MSRRFRRLKWAGATLGLGIVWLYLGNTSSCAEPIGPRAQLIAHRGMAQDFEREGLTGNTCTASRMLDSGHAFLENTLPSMQAAFDIGADVVEFDVHPTLDGRFAVFHDWTVDCRTEGRGVTREQTLAELQALDVGYGYTADGGATFPFRGQGVGLMPSLDEVLQTFPDRHFIIDVKGNDPHEGERLAERLAEATRGRTGEISVYGGPLPVATVRKRLPGIRTMTRPRLKRCLVRYIAMGFSGHVPADCRDGLLFVPANVAPWLWGWPNRLLQRMELAGTRVVLIGDYGGEGFSNGFNDPARVTDLPSDYAGGIWTDRIDRVGPAVRARSQGSR